MNNKIIIASIFTLIIIIIHSTLKSVFTSADVTGSAESTYYQKIIDNVVENESQKRMVKSYLLTAFIDNKRLRDGFLKNAYKLSFMNEKLFDTVESEWKKVFDNKDDNFVEIMKAASNAELAYSIPLNNNITKIFNAAADFTTSKNYKMIMITNSSETSRLNNTFNFKNVNLKAIYNDDFDIFNMRFDNNSVIFLDFLWDSFVIRIIKKKILNILNNNKITFIALFPVETNDFNIINLEKINELNRIEYKMYPVPAAETKYYHAYRDEILDNPAGPKQLNFNLIVIKNTAADFKFNF